MGMAWDARLQACDATLSVSLDLCVAGGKPIGPMASRDCGMLLREVSGSRSRGRWTFCSCLCQCVVVVYGGLAFASQLSHACRRWRQVGGEGWVRHQEPRSSAGCWIQARANQPATYYATVWAGSSLCCVFTRKRKVGHHHQQQ